MARTGAVSMAVDYSSSGHGRAFTQNFYLLHQEFGQTPVSNSSLGGNRAPVKLLQFLLTTASRGAADPAKSNLPGANFYACPPWVPRQSGCWRRCLCFRSFFQPILQA